MEDDEVAEIYKEGYGKDEYAKESKPKKYHEEDYYEEKEVRLPLLPHPMSHAGS